MGLDDTLYGSLAYHLTLVGQVFLHVVHILGCTPVAYLSDQTGLQLLVLTLGDDRGQRGHLLVGYMACSHQEVYLQSVPFAPLIVVQLALHEESEGIVVAQPQIVHTCLLADDLVDRVEQAHQHRLGQVNHHELGDLQRATPVGARTEHEHTLHELFDGEGVAEGAHVSVVVLVVVV